MDSPKSRTSTGCFRGFAQEAAASPGSGLDDSLNMRNSFRRKRFQVTSNENMISQTKNRVRACKTAHNMDTAFLLDRAKAPGVAASPHILPKGYTPVHSQVQTSGVS